MKKIVERFLIKILKLLKVNLLAHAHVQIGVGHNTYSSGEKHIIDNLLIEILGKEPTVIFDVGANIGQYAHMLRDRFKTAEIYCFEPVIENYSRLKANVLNLNITCENYAVGSKMGILTLFTGSNDEDGAMSTSYKGAIEHIFTFAGNMDQEISSTMITIDDYCDMKIDNIDFLKIDIEGHELEALKGSVSMINRNKINVIQFEFNEFNLFSKSSMFDFYHILKEFDLYRIMPNDSLYAMGTYNSIHEIYRYQNILAVNKSLKYVQ
ncbi:FkbM family methyltransferase [Pedobacter sp. UC225_61]|uniref:FkbM family methyltransferase n=1 Tax=Pedobacter sp. UC225_61 TaxID=3374623 RepID=UPI0037AC9DA2